MKYKLSPPISGGSYQIHLDGSKSISNRLLILQNNSTQSFEIDNLSTSDDTKLLQSFFQSFPTHNSFNVQNAGTVARFLTAFLANQPGKWILNCAPAMKNRPISILVDALVELGADITYLENEGVLPIQINGKQLNGGRLEMPATVSSQYISAVLMVAPTFNTPLILSLTGKIASQPYLTITENCMQQTGYNISFHQNIYSIALGQQTPNTTIFVESDWSAAAFYYGIVALNSNISVELSNLLSPSKSAQGDAEVANLFQQLGVVSTTYTHQKIRLEHANSIVKKFSANFYNQPDMVPAVAVTCAALGIDMNFEGVVNLAIKESNRLQALQNELQKVGVSLKKIDDDNWVQTGKIDQQLLKSVTFETYDDHRIAMSFAMLGFLYEDVTINHPEVVSKSYANFWEDMKQLGLQINKT